MKTRPSFIPYSMLPGALNTSKPPQTGQPIILDVANDIPMALVAYGPAIGFSTPGMKGFVNLENPTELVSPVASAGWLPCNHPGAQALLRRYHAALAANQ